jgi:DNA mismatch repair protein MutL
VSRIAVLSRHLVNKIAAGEVIERPASVVKELVENALDAGASRIEIDVEDGGKRRITVTDDGIGMSEADLKLAFAPHATSKLAGEDDLFRIATMGFRGEALASIASISHAHVRTRPRDDDSQAGWELSASGDQIGRPAPAAAPPGTSITVRDLFFNTPARRKFLRTASTEIGHISEQLARVALAHPQVAFRLTHNKRDIHNLPAVTATQRRIEDFFGRELADQLIPLVPRTGEVAVEGLIGRPAAARSSGKWQYLFLNGRYIRDRLILHALREAYRGLLAPTRWPVAFLFVTVPPADVDVNVHPTKIEVRFRDGQRVHGEVFAALKETLNRAQLTPEPSLHEEATDDLQPQADPTDQDTAGEHRRANLRQALADFFKQAPRPQGRLDFPPHRYESEPADTHADPADEDDAPARPTGRPVGPVIPNRLPPASRQRTDEQADAPAGEDAPPRPAKAATVQASLPGAPPSAALPVLQLADTYLVYTEADGLVIIDQHALHERILYNELSARLASGRLASQRLLIPETLAVTCAEADLLGERSELLESLGIHVEPFGPESVAIQQFPALLSERGVKPCPFLRQLLDDWAELDGGDSEQALDRVLSMMACKAAVKAGDPLTPEEIADLLARREDQAKVSACPHGRPTTLRVSLTELRKHFHRS